MDVVSPQAFWLIRNGLGEVPEPLPTNRRCDVLVIGAGITGALVADALTAEGLHVIAIDRRNPGLGSTSASTALLQYELDIHLADLITRVGRERAVAGYRACLEGVRAIARIANDLTDDVDFRRRPQPLPGVAIARCEGSAQRMQGAPTVRASLRNPRQAGSSFSRRLQLASRPLEQCRR